MVAKIRLQMRSCRVTVSADWIIGSTSPEVRLLVPQSPVRNPVSQRQYCTMMPWSSPKRSVSRAMTSGSRIARILTRGSKALRTAQKRMKLPTRMTGME